MTSYNPGDMVWYCGERKAVVTDSMEDDYYEIALGASDKAVATAHMDELKPRETRMRETVRDMFGGVKVTAQGKEHMEGREGYITYNIPAQGAGDELSAEEARLVAEAFREGEEGLMLIIDDDPHEVAQAFERAADRVEEYTEE